MRPSRATFPALTLLGGLLAAGCADTARGNQAERNAATTGSVAHEAALGVHAFVGARIFDGTGAPVIENGIVVVRDGRITAVGRAAEVAVPPDAAVVELEGRWLVPGLVNAHAHVNGDRAQALEQLELYAHYGVTTVLSLGDDAADFRDVRESPALRYARLFVAGPSISPATPAEARATVAELHGRGVDWIKTHMSGGRMTPEVLGAIVEEARERGLPVAVHIEALEPAKRALRTGAALIGHSVRDVPVDQELIDLMRARDVCLVPTFTRELSTFVYAERPDFFDDPFFLERAAPADLEGFLTPRLQEQSRGAGAQRWREALPLAQRNMVRLHQAGVGIAMGTDSGAPTGRFQGYFEHLELEMMADAGMSPLDIMVAATGRAAECIGMEEDVGTIRPGRWADFVALDANPLEDVRNAREIHGVWIAGNEVER
jgi:imidazolonepropionase-like amidohydrolase